jgi:hypothetical protein
MDTGIQTRMKQSYYVAAIWDAEASVWFSQSNIPGLVIEADTVAEFEKLMDRLAPEMLAINENIHNERVPVEFRFTETREFAVV